MSTNTRINYSELAEYTRARRAKLQSTLDTVLSLLLKKETSIVSVFQSFTENGTERVDIEAIKYSLDFKIFIEDHDDNILIAASYDGYNLARHHFFDNEVEDRQEMWNHINEIIGALENVKHREDELEASK
jgi:hypothetical protein